MWYTCRTTAVPACSACGVESYQCAAAITRGASRWTSSGCSPSSSRNISQIPYHKRQRVITSLGRMRRHEQTTQLPCALFASFCQVRGVAVTGHLTGVCGLITPCSRPLAFPPTLLGQRGCRERERQRICIYIYIYIYVYIYIYIWSTGPPNPPRRMGSCVGHSTRARAPQVPPGVRGKDRVY